ncbi:hypothetical protein EXU57_05010 [Segetibacter sp. 3557_3]|uniref:hypothetical protein n=1 Tax=Segetibacter sp. 3557_3 TaxID=2547429 RepID=UPI001058BB4D|nr:hypothetical protein [Segetibacter sp. 3557_3]TDH27828.1 hypothetical protein EXU57_05010 [Segetibacter sp. 3557_3]
MQLLLNNQINKKQWDDCIQKAADGLIYSTSLYLDHLSPGWVGLTAHDYSWIMPLTRRRKFGIEYLYQPSFLQQSGVFVCDPGIAIPWEKIDQFLKAHYHFWEINLRPGAYGKFKGAQYRKANNFVLHLDREYQDIQTGYSGAFRKNLKRAGNAELIYTEKLDYQSCIRLYHQYYGSRMPHVSGTDYRNFGRLCEYLYQSGGLYCRGVANGSGELMAAILLLADNRRLYNLMNITLQKGKLNQSNHFLFDQLIREFQGSGKILDLEGSDLAGVQQFYEGMGSTNEPYCKIKYNGLPWPIRWLKK